ncbi:MAG: aminotransferase class I/II-fold pyridoxal phosphate-dependent enzyme [Bryobacteraceae bacterium]
MPSSVVSRLRPTAVNSVLGEVRALQAQGVKVVSLMRGEPDFRTPEHIVEAAVRALRAGRTTYPDNRGEIKLRETIASQRGYDPAEILVTTGATLGIACALTALLDPGDEVLLPDPIYDAYQSPIRMTGAEPRAVASHIDHGRFAISVESLEQAWSPKAKILLLNTPWNPVGTVFREDELRAIGDFVLRRGLTLISDEIYETITYAGARHISPVTLSPELRERIVLVNSLSKTYAMTGWRVGYCAAPKQIIDAMFLVLQQSSRGPAMFVQDAAAEALTGPQECVEIMRAEYARRRARVLEALSGVPRITAMPPEGGFFTMVDTKGLGESSNETRKRLLERHGVVVIHGAAYGQGGEGTLRVSFSSGATLEDGLARLRAGLAEG